MSENKTIRPCVLIVDDDKNTREGLSRALNRNYEILVAENAEKALDLLYGSQVDILLSDVRMPGMDGLTLMQRALARQPGLICILLTAYGNVETAVEAMKRGAFDFLMKPVNLDHLDLLLKKALRSRLIESENTRLQEELNDKYGLEHIVGNSGVMRHLFEVVKQSAVTQATVLLQGESGTGKELVAHAIHRLSPRSKGPFVAIHCAALAPTLLESELFGHEKGAFTGAISRRRGRFELADGGTLFLDEISEIDLAIQVKLLRVLEEQRFERVGGDQTLDVDIRLIAATNRNLKELVDAGKFREDLFFRLDVVNIVLPPLRERPDDIPLLCSHFVEEFGRKNEKKIEGITPEAIEVLSQYSWPGNVRELRNTVEKMAVLARGSRFGVRDIPPNIKDAARGGSDRPLWEQTSAQHGAGAKQAQPGAKDTRQPDSLAHMEKTVILATLKKHDDNRTKAAAELGISRRTLHRKLKRYGEEKHGAGSMVHGAEEEKNAWDGVQHG